MGGQRTFDMYSNESFVFSLPNTWVRHDIYLSEIWFKIRGQVVSSFFELLQEKSKQKNVFRIWFLVTSWCNETNQYVYYINIVSTGSIYLWVLAIQKYFEVGSNHSIFFRLAWNCLTQIISNIFSRVPKNDNTIMYWQYDKYSLVLFNARYY